MLFHLRNPKFKTFIVGREIGLEVYSFRYQEPALPTHRKKLCLFEMDCMKLRALVKTKSALTDVLALVFGLNDTSFLCY